MKKYILILILLWTYTALGQKIYVDVSSSNQYPAVGKKIKLTYTLKMQVKGGMASISHSGISIERPNFGTMNVVDEGTEGSSFGFGGLGGKDMELKKYSFILQPTKKGKVTIGPFSFIMNGEKYTSDSYTFTVGEGDPNAKIVPKQNGDYFLRTEVSNRSMYKGEHALVTYKLYTHFSNVSIPDFEFPLTNGVWKEELKQPKGGWPQNQVTINGKGYIVVTLKKEIVFPQKTGEIKIEPISLTLNVGGGFFSAGKKADLVSNSPKIDVKPLPSGAPASFNNQVGKKYELEMDYSTDKLKSGEAIDVTIKVSGNGNLRQLQAPELTFPADFETYEPETNESIKLNSSGLSGYKEFNYLVIPRHHGEFEIPAFEYSYFDIETGSYKTFTNEGLTIYVSKGENTNSTLSSNGNFKEDVELLNTGIRHIHAETTLHSTTTTFVNTTKFWAGLIAPPALFALFMLFAFKKEDKDSVIKQAKKGAKKNVFKTLSRAEIALKEKKTVVFYDELHRGILKYLGDKLGVSPASLDKQKLEDLLSSKSVSKDHRADLHTLISDCEMARFAPITHTAATKSLTEAKELILNLEKYAI